MMGKHDVNESRSAVHVQSAWICVHSVVPQGRGLVHIVWRLFSQSTKSLTYSIQNPLTAVRLRPSVIHLPGNLHVDAAVVHHVHRPLLQPEDRETRFTASLISSD